MKNGMYQVTRRGMPDRSRLVQFTSAFNISNTPGEIGVRSIIDIEEEGLCDGGHFLTLFRKMSLVSLVVSMQIFGRLQTHGPSAGDVKPCCCLRLSNCFCNLFTMNSCSCSNAISMSTFSF